MVSLINRHDEINRPARLERGEYRSDDIRHYFYTQNWQCVEERATADDSDVPAPEDLDPDMQYVWGLRYIDDLILRDRDTTGNGNLTERLYAMQDANWNVVALAESDGDVVERYLYSAYGDPLVLNADFAEDSDGTDYAWEFRFTGRRTDLETDLMYYRNRMYHPELGRFVSRDPVGYEDGFNLFRYVGDRPTNAIDPTGTSASSEFVRAFLGHLTPRAGIKQDIRACTRATASVCVCGIVRVEDELRHCCRNGRKTLCNIFRFDISVGVYECTSLGGTGFLTPQFPLFKVTYSPAKKRPISGIAGGGNTACPQDGWDGSVCITASVGFSAWTYGARGCYNFGAENTTIDVGFGIGTGTGVAGSGSGTYTTCGLL